MDALYLFCHSRANDLEIRYSLRSLAQHLPFIRKVWIFGDRPAFLSSDTSLIEHVPHEYAARLDRSPVPVRNTFKMLFLSSLIGDLTAGYLWMCDDYVLLEPLTAADVQRNRYVEDMDDVPVRGAGLWKEAMWRTYELLKRLGYPVFNFEAHCPTYLRKRWVFDAYCDFQDFVTDDRFYGMIGPSAILNHALKHHHLPLTKLASENWRAGFYERSFPYEEIVEHCRGRKFLNFDDEGFGDDLRRFLDERFPEPCVYEQNVPAAAATGVTDPRSTSVQRSTSVPVQLRQTDTGTHVATATDPPYVSAEADTPALALERLSRKLRKPVDGME